MTYIRQKDLPFGTLPPNWDDGWRKAKDRMLRSAGAGTIWFVGDSLFAGHKASTDANTCRRTVRDSLVTTYGQGADYYPISLSVGQTMDSGTATSATSTTLSCSSKTWGTTQYVNAYVYLTGGTGAGQWRQIASHTNTQLTLASAWTTTPDTTSTFIIGFLTDGYCSNGLLQPFNPWAIGSTTKRAQAISWAVGTDYIGSLGAIRTALLGMGGEGTWVSGSGGIAAGDVIATFTAPSYLGSLGDFDFVYYNGTANSGNPAGQWNYDGGAYTNWTATADTTLGIVQVVRGGSAGTGKVINLKAIGTAQMWPSGVTAWKNLTTGVRFAHLGHDGSILSNMALNYLTKTLQARDAGGTLGALGFPMKPDLVICNYIGSETGTYSPDVSAVRMSHFIESLRWVNPDVSFLFLAPYRPNGVTNDGQAYDLFALNYAPAVELQIEVASRYDCAHLNANARWKGRGIANGFITGDPEIHWNDAGHADVASFILSAL